MNERILELAKQAGEYVNESYTPPVRSKTPEKIWEDGHVDWHTQFNQKFAELIVKKCLEQCYYRGMNDGLYAGQLKAAAYIEEYFGVKEPKDSDCPLCGEDGGTTCGIPDCQY